MASTIMESFFQKSLEDLVKGLRVQMIGEARYLSKAMDEIHQEIKSTDHHIKAVALQKLTYLNMLQGFDMSWAAFHVVEVMSMPRFCHKKIGYLAASQSFQEDTEVLLLITNQLRKDLTSTNEYEAGLALECLSRIATPDLARDLTPDVFTMLGSSKLYVKKKATLVLLRIFNKYPDAVRIAFKRLVENLEDSDPQVACAAVSVFCELAMKDPKAYLPLAPEFYRLLIDSTNNWLLIKIVKIFGVLAPLEPRLGRKIVEPICEHMNKTAAKSLLLECIRTVVSGLTDNSSAVKLAVVKLKDLMMEDDPNLKYLGLQALAALMPKQLWAVCENKEVIIKALSDSDPTIQLASLRLIMGMISENNVVDMVRVLMHYALISDPKFCNEILNAILFTCSGSLYELVVDFGWYVSVLGDIARIPHCKHGQEVERQLVDIGMRVKDVRPELVKVARNLLIDPALLGYPLLHRALSAAAWIAGEYAEHLQNPFEIIESLLQPRTNLLSPSVKSVYLQSVLKVFVFYCYLHLKRSQAFGYKFCVNDSKAVQGVRLLSLENDHTIEEVDAKCKKPIQRAVSGLTSLKDELTGPGFCEGNSAMASMQEETSSAGLQRSSSASGKLEKRGLEEFEDEETFNPRLNLPSREGPDELIDVDKLSLSDEQAGLSESPGKEHDSYSSLVHLVKLIKLTVGPLSESEDVEVQERACNLLGLLKALEETPGFLVEKQGPTENQDIWENQCSETVEIITCMHSIFAEELSPVSVLAQGRVPVPDGLVLKENLDDLVKILGDDQSMLDEGKEWSGSQHREWDNVPVFSQPTKEESVPFGESTSLLAQHRQRHGAFYLPTEKTETKNDDYPPPHMSQPDVLSAASDASKDILKLAEQSLLSTKPQRTKARPVVVRLDEGDEAPILATKQGKDLKENFISNAIRDVLSGDKSKHSVGSGNGDPENKSKVASSGHHRRSGWRSESSSKRVEKKGIKVDDKSVDIVEGHMDGREKHKTERHSSRRHKHSKHGKETYKSSDSSNDEKDAHKGKHLRGHPRKENHHHAKHRNRQRADSPLQVAPQTPVIPDFLL
eukprot:Gb_30646 [translate_table: standard]